MIARIRAQTRYPARFMLVAAMNPCPCGYLGSSRCRCTPDQVRRYRDRISGPLLDRIDLQVPVLAVPREQLTAASVTGVSSAETRSRVTMARQRQLRRQGKLNNSLTGQQLKQYCPLNRHQQRLLDNAIDKLGLSARAYHRILKVARSIADLESDEAIDERHITEALSFRLADQGSQHP